MASKLDRYPLRADGLGRLCVCSRRRTELVLPGLTFEVTGHQRQDAKPGPVKMYRVPPARAWWPAVGAPVDRRVRQRCDRVPSAMHVAAQLGVTDWPAGLTASRSAPMTFASLVFGAVAAGALRKAHTLTAAARRTDFRSTQPKRGNISSRHGVAKSFCWWSSPARSWSIRSGRSIL